MSNNSFDFDKILNGLRCCENGCPCSECPYENQVSMLLNGYSCIKTRREDLEKLILWARDAYDTLSTFTKG